MRRSPVRHLAAALAAVVGFGAVLLGATGPANATTVRPLPIAERIDLTSSGGIAGETRHVAVDHTTTDPRARHARLLASTPMFRALAPSYQPEHLCCDLIRYDLKVSFSDGAVQTVQTWTAARAPRLLWDVIRLTERSGVPVKPVTADKIVLIRSGSGAQDTFTIDRSNNHPRAAQALTMVAGEEFRALEANYEPDPCCLPFTYEVTVSYSDGSIKTVTTWDKATPPKVLWQVIALAAEVGEIT